MSHKPVDEMPLTPRDNGLNVPIWFRLVAAVLALAMVVPSIALYVRYVIDPARNASPAELGTGNLILAGILILIFALTPWKTLGLRVHKVGFLEFERVVTRQASEHAEELTELRTRIDEMELHVRGIDDLTPIREHLEDLELYPLLSKFLADFAPTAYSPIRIREWGSRQHGYEKLSSYKISEIRRVLQKLVAEGRAATRVSRLGSTLYKVAD